jgi:hypothetical protein
LPVIEESGREEVSLQIFRTVDHEAQKNRNARAVATTCQWCLDHPSYLHWLDDKSSNLLWLSADPDCGKPVLARKLVDEDFKDLNCVRTYYFFKRDGGEGQDKASTAPCSMHHNSSAVLRSAGPVTFRAVSAIEASDGQVRQLFDELRRVLIEGG